jgi:UDP-N-acetylmuramate dehydrogenase
MSWRTKANRDWLSGLPGIEEQHPLAKQTSFNIGGPAEYFVQSEQAEELVKGCLERDIPYLLLGAGTNLLVADAGVEGLVIRCVDREYRVEAARVYASAGLKMLRLARLCASHDLTGFEWAIGVPGTVGGAVYQNAGCWGGQLADVLIEAQGFQPGRGPQTWSKEQLALGYRTSALRTGPLRGSLVTGVWLRLAPGDGEAARQQMAHWTEEKSRSQPIRTKNCGSVFKNPNGDFAARLVEAGGLKGARRGGAVVSEQHANFIVNTGDATAADVDGLIKRIQATIWEGYGVALEPEVEWVGKW